jgi:hypothetical protein
MRCDEVIRELAVLTDERDSTLLAEHLACCPPCAAWAERAAGLDRLWAATRPQEPSSEVWDALWARLTPSLDASMPHELHAFAPSVPSQNGSSANGKTHFPRPLPSPRTHRRRWVAIGLIGIAQAAAVLLAVGLSWHSLVPTQPPEVALAPELTSAPSISKSGAGLPSLPESKGPARSEFVSVTVSSEAFPTVIEEGRLVVIHADSKPRKVLLPIFSSHSTFLIQAEGQIPTVVDLTPEGVSYGVDDWYLVFNSVESLTNPKVAMKE